MSGSVLCSCCLSNVWKPPSGLMVFVFYLEVSSARDACLMSARVFFFCVLGTCRMSGRPFSFSVLGTCLMSGRPFSFSVLGTCLMSPSVFLVFV